VVSPAPGTRRPPPISGPGPLPPSAGRRPPSYQSGGARTHGGRRLLVLVLILATVGAVGYFYVAGGSAASTSGFVGAEQRFVAATQAITTAAQKVQRFTELHTFDLAAQAQIATMSTELTNLQRIDAGASGRQRQIADQTVSVAQQAIDAAGRYRRAVALTYRLVDANTARQDLSNAVRTLDQQAQAWQHA
jgi:hypothetical protein